MMSIPWDDPYDDRPTWLPDIGEPVDPETAARIIAHYGPEIAAALAQVAAILRARHHEDAVTVRQWMPDELRRDWSADADGVLAAFVTLDDRDRGKSFRSVLIVVDKTSGVLVTLDPSGLLNG